MTDLGEIVALYQEFGIFQVFLPLLLVFTVIYAILAKTKIFDDKRINLVISAILAFLVIGYTAPGIEFAAYIGRTFTGTSVVIVTLLGAMMILYIVGTLLGLPIRADKITQKGWVLLLVGIFLVLALGVFISSGGRAFFPGLVLPNVQIPQIPIPVIPSIGLTTAHLAALVMVLGLALVAWYVSKEGSGGSK